MSSETYTYKGISAGKYVEGDIEALNQEEASFKLKEQKIIITNLVRSKKKKATKEKKKGGGFSFGKKSSRLNLNGSTSKTLAVNECAIFLSLSINSTIISSAFLSFSIIDSLL